MKRILALMAVCLFMAALIGQELYPQNYEEYQGKEFELIQIPFNQTELDSVFVGYDVFSCGDYFARALVRPLEMLMLYFKLPDTGNLGFMIFPTKKFKVEIDESCTVPTCRLQLNDECLLDYVKIRLSRNEFDNSLCLPSPPSPTEQKGKESPKKNTSGSNKS